MFYNQIGSIENLYSAAGGAQNSSSQVLGSLLAEYTYSAYGDVLMKSGELADKNHVTYSTRYSEGNTGLIYYTYRHYAPRLHKWINKDPIAEEGGINLYQMVGNDTICNWDILGCEMKPVRFEVGVGMGGTVFKISKENVVKAVVQKEIENLIMNEISKARAFLKKPWIFKVFSMTPTIARIMNSAGFVITDAYVNVQAECLDECLESKCKVSAQRKTDASFIILMHPLNPEMTEDGISVLSKTIGDLLDSVLKKLKEECDEKK